VRRAIIVKGGGVEGDVAGEHIVIGSPRFLAERFGAEQVAAAMQAREQLGAHDTLATMIGINGRVRSDME
jgi:cation transport ATPase